MSLPPTPIHTVTSPCQLQTIYVIHALPLKTITQHLINGGYCFHTHAFLNSALKILAKMDGITWQFIGDSHDSNVYQIGGRFYEYG